MTGQLNREGNASKSALMVAGMCAATFLFYFHSAHALIITEVMYDLEGSDSKREWVEIYNNGSAEVNLSDWRFNDGSNHVLNEPPQNGGSGSLMLGVNEYAILASDATTFISFYSVSVSVIDTVINLGQQDDSTYTLKLINDSGGVVDEVSYTTLDGAYGDGNSLQLLDGQWSPGKPTPGTSNTHSALEEEEQEEAAGAPPGGGAPPVSPASYFGPRFEVDAGGDRTVTVGAHEVFSGEALGLEDQLLTKSRFLWNFGDGTVREGRSVLHAYRHPGTYVVTLDVSSGENVGSERIRVQALPADILISGVEIGFDGYIELSNHSTREISIGSWHLSLGDDFFTFPKYSVLLAGTATIFPTQATGLQVQMNDQVSLLYPNGETAVVYGIVVGAQTRQIETEPLVVVEPASSVPVTTVVTEEQLAEEEVIQGKPQEEAKMQAAAPVQAPSSGMGKWIAALTFLIGGGALALVMMRTKETHNE